MAEFMSNIPHYKRNTVETVRLAIAAREHLKDHARREGFDFNCEERGILHVYDNAKEFKHATKVTLEPALPAGLHGGYYTRSD